MKKTKYAAGDTIFLRGLFCTVLDLTSFAGVMHYRILALNANGQREMYLMACDLLDLLVSE